MREELVKSVTDEVKATLELVVSRELRKHGRGDPADAQASLFRLKIAVDMRNSCRCV